MFGGIAATVEQLAVCPTCLSAPRTQRVPIVCCMTQTDSLWTFEIEGPGYPGGYYTPAEEWAHADAAARWLVRALHDFGAIGGLRRRKPNGGHANLRR